MTTIYMGASFHSMTPLFFSLLLANSFCFGSRYEEERLPRVKTVYQKGKSSASAEDKEKFLYKPTFKPLWRTQVHLLQSVHTVHVQVNRSVLLRYHEWRFLRRHLRANLKLMRGQHVAVTNP